MWALFSFRIWVSCAECLTCNKRQASPHPEKDPHEKDPLTRGKPPPTQKEIRINKMCIKKIRIGRPKESGKKTCRAPSASE